MFSEITAPMVLKFRMQHDQTAGLQSDKIQPGKESKMAFVTKNSKTNKINLFSRTVWCIWLKVCMANYLYLGFQRC